MLKFAQHLRLDMVRYFYEDTEFRFGQKRLNNRWLKSAAGNENRSLGDVNIVFCSDNYLLDINLRYLQHDYYTDIITFDYCEGSTLSGDLFISIDSVRDNASHFGAGFDDELNRVIVHGLLHLIGYDDHTPEEQSVMRAKEDYYLGCRKSMI